MTNITSLTFTPGTGTAIDYEAGDRSGLLWNRDTNGYVLTFEDGVSRIGDYMYLHPTGSLSIPSSVKEIGNYAFAEANFNTLVISDGLEKIESHAFDKCSSLASVTIPGTIKTIEPNVFSNCTSLAVLTLPITATFNKSIFTGCPLDTFNFTMGTDGKGYEYTADTVKDTPWYAAINNSKNITVTFGDGIVSIGKFMFDGCFYKVDGTDYGLRADLVFPSTLTGVGESAFDGCEGVTSVALSGIQTIGAHAFRGCIKLASVNVGTSVSAIGEGAFSGCTGMQALTIPVTMNAVGYADDPIFGNCANLANLTITSGVVSGAENGTGVDYSEGEGNLDFTKTPWYLSRNHDISLTIGHGVNTIGNNMFRGSGVAGALDLPSTLTGVGENAFRDCTRLTSLTVTSGTTLGLEAFAGCTGIKNLTIPISVNPVRSASRPVFRDCTGITNLRFTGDGVIDYREGDNGNGYTLTPWYYSRSNVINVAFDDSVKAIGNNMFRGCTNLTSVGDTISMPNVTKIGEHAFSDCTKFTGLIAPALSNAGVSAFSGCTGLVKADVRGVTSAPASLFEDCTGLSDLTIGSLTSIGEGAFSDTSSLTTVNGTQEIAFPALASIGNRAFERSGIISMTLGGSAGALDFGDRVFLDCPGLESLTIVPTVTNFPADTFRSNDTPESFESQLKTLTVPGVRNFYAVMANDFPNLETVDISGARNFSTSGSEGQFQNCTSLATVKLFNDTSSNIKIRPSASMFEGCTSLTTINLDCVDLTNARVFYGCTSLTTITIPVSENIPSETFAGCTRLADVSAPAAKTIGEKAFTGTALASIEAGMFDAVTSIGASAFENCGNLGTVTLPAHAATVGDYAFRGCNTLGTFDGTAVSAISKGMFSGCTSLQTVTADSALSIGTLAFSGCNGLTSLSMKSIATIGTINNDITDIDDTSDFGTDSDPRVFFGCTNLATVTMPSLTTVGTMAFYGCGGLTTINGASNTASLPKATYIGVGAFSGTALANVTIGSEASDITVGDYAFYRCTQLNSFSAPTATSLPVHLFSVAYAVGSDGKVNETLAGQLRSVSVPKLTSFGIDLHNCANLTSVAADSATTFADHVFYHCTSLTAFTMPAAVTVGNGTFEGCSAMDTVKAPQLTTIGERAFYGCVALKSFSADTDQVSLANASSIGANAFEGCVGIKDLLLGDATLGDYAFRGCTGIAALTIPMSANTVVSANGENHAVFDGCTGIASVSFTGNSNGYDYTEETYTLTPWYVGTGSDRHITVTLADTIPYIGDYTFADSAAITGEIKLPDAMTGIGDYAFRNCGITALVIPNNHINNLGEGVFSGCTVLVSLTIPIEFNAAGETATAIFGGCTGLTDVHFTGVEGHDYTTADDGSLYTNTPWYLSRGSNIAVTFADSVRTIGDNMFRGCTGLAGTASAANATEIGAHAFEGCASITTFVGSAVTTVGEAAFMGDSKLTTATMTQISTLGADAFRNTGIKTIGTTDGTADLTNATSIGDRAFAGSKVVNVTIGKTGTAVTLGSNVFADCADLESLVVNGTMASLPATTFTSLTTSAATTAPKLKKLLLPHVTVFTLDMSSGFADIEEVDISSVTSLTVTGQFKGCANLTTVRLYDGQLTLPASIFEGCANLTNINIDKVNLANGREFFGCEKLNNVHLVNASQIPASSFEGCKALSVFTAVKATSVGDRAFAGSGMTQIAATTFPIATSVGASAFEGCASLTSVALSDATTRVGENAFKGCVILTRFSSANLDTIAAGTFSGCAALNTVSADKATRIGAAAFSGCGQLQSIALPMVNTIEDGETGAFEGCTILNTVKMPSLTSVGQHAFKDCRQLSSFNSDGRIADLTGITQLGAGAFSQCVGITSIDIPIGLDAAVSEIDPAFAGCTLVNRVHFSGTAGHDYSGEMYKLTPWFFSKDNTLDVTFDASVSEIGDNMFRECTGYKSALVLGESMSSIGYHAFDGSGITSITIGSDETSLGQGAFKNCTSLETLVLPISADTVGDVSDPAFEGCGNIKKITFTGTEGADYSDTYTHTPWYVVSTSGNSIDIVIADTVTSIGAHMFDGCSAISGKIELSANMARVGDSAFHQTNMKELVITNPAAEIGEHAFSDNAGLTRLTMPIEVNAVANFDSPVFEGCDKIASFTFTGTVGHVYSDNEDDSYYTKTPWFRSTANSVRVSFADTVQSIGAYMFKESKLTGSADLNNTVTVGTQAFYGSEGIRSVTGNKVTSIGISAFEGASAMTGATLTSVTAVSDRAFFGCAALRQADLGNVATVGVSAFEGCAALININGSGVSLPHVNSVGDRAFASSGVADVTLGSATATGSFTLGKQLFDGCTALETLRIDGSINSLPDTTFGDTPSAPALKNLYLPTVKSFTMNMSSGFPELTVLDIRGAPTIANYDGQFRGLTKLTDVTLFSETSANLVLPASAFEGDTALTNINLDAVFLNTNGRQFFGCTSLDNVNLGSSTSVPKSAFEGCTSLKTLTVVANTIAERAFAASGLQNVSMTSVTTVGPSAFTDCGSLVTVSLPNAATINDGAFAGCVAMTTFSADNVTALSQRLFEGDGVLGKVYVKSAISVAALAFKDCAGLRQLTLENVETIGTDAQDGQNQNDVSVFFGCTQLNSVTAPKLNSVGDYAFYGCRGLTSLNAPSSERVVDISGTSGGVGDYAFKECTSISNLLLGSGQLSKGTFEGCLALNRITLPMSVNTVVSTSAPAFGGVETVMSVTFTGNVDGWDYTAENCGLTPWNASTATAVAVDLGDTKSIGDFTFYNMVTIRGALEVDMPVGVSAFSGCRNITSLVLGEGATLSESSFAGCVGLVSLTIPIEVDAVVGDSDAASAFFGCAAIANFTFTGTEGHDYKNVIDGDSYYLRTPWHIANDAGVNITVRLADTVTSVGDYMFADCNRIGGELSFSENVSSLGDYAYRGCGITSVAIANANKDLLGAGTFENCASLASLTIPIEVNAVGDGDHPAFAGCTAITAVHFIGAEGFDYTQYGSTDVKKTPWRITTQRATIDFASSVTSIGNFAFYECSAFSGAVEMNDSIGSIGENAFSRCTGITSLTIAREDIEIGASAFAGCSGITALSIAMSIDSVKDAANAIFASCSGITSVTLTGNMAGWDYTEDTYTHTPWYLSRGHQITVSVTGNMPRIGDYTFAGCTGISGDITVPDTVNSIGDHAFMDCKGITGFTGVNVSTVEQAVFSGCTSMTQATMRGISNVSDSLFEGCSKLATAELGTVSVVGNDAFRNSGITTIRDAESDPDGVLTLSSATVIGDRAFAGSMAKNVVIGTSGVSITIGKNVFADCSELESLTVSGTIATIPGTTFESLISTGTSSAVKLRKLILPTVTSFLLDLSNGGFPSLEEIDIRNAAALDSENGHSGQFSNLTSLKKVTLFTTDTTRSVILPASAFEGDTSLTTINLEDATLQNGRVFFGCTSLDNVVLGSGSSNIPASAFEGCTSLKHFTSTLTGGVRVYDRAFANSGFTEFTADTIPGLVSLGASAFEGCANLATVTLSDNTRQVGVYAFRDCTALTSFTSGSLTAIPTGMFSGCSSLADVSADAVQTINDLAFSGCTALTSVSFPNAKTIVSASSEDGGAFSGCTALTAVSMPNLDAVGDYAFYKCAQLRSVNDSEGHIVSLAAVSTIGKYAFAETGATDIVVGSEGNIIGSISDYAFYGCDQLTSFSSPTLTELPAHLFSNADQTLGSEVPLLETVDVPKVITFGADLHATTTLTRINAPAAISFADYAFARCTGLTEVSFPAAGAISDHMMEGCIGMTSFSAPVASSIGEYAFNGDYRLDTAVIPEVRSVGDYAFNGCSALANINPGTGLNPLIRMTSIGSYSFSGTRLTKAVLGPGLSSLGTYAFANSSRLAMVTIPNSIATVSEGAFAGCPVTEAYFAANVGTIERGAFDYSTAAGVTSAAFYFNGDVTSAMINAVHIRSGAMVLNVHAAESCKDAVPESNSIVFHPEVRALITVIAEDGTQDAQNAVYGGRVVVPFAEDNTGKLIAYYVSTKSIDTVRVYAYEEDFDATYYNPNIEDDTDDSRTARSGDAVPVYPLAADQGVVLNATQEEMGVATFVVKSNPSEGVTPTEQTVHYGQVMTIPRFDNDKLEVVAVTLVRQTDNMGAGQGLPIDKDTRSVRVGYVYSYIQLSSQNMSVYVTFISDHGNDAEADRKDYPVYYGEVFLAQGSFVNPEDLLYVTETMQKPNDGYTFAGWYDMNGLKVEPGKDTFVAGMTYTAKFDSIHYTISFTGVEQNPVEAHGPFRLMSEKDEQTGGLKLSYTDDVYSESPKDISVILTGYKVTSYYNVTTYHEVENDEGTMFHQDVTINVTIQERTFRVDLKFNAGESTEGVDFRIDGWTNYGIHKRGDSEVPDPKNMYLNGDYIDNITYTVLSKGIPVPTAYDEYFSQRTVSAGGADATVLTYDTFGGASKIDLVYEMQSGVFAVRYFVNDDAGNTVPASTTVVSGGTFSIIPMLDTYTKSGWNFDGYYIEGAYNEGDTYSFYQPGQVVEFTSDLEQYAEDCVLTMQGHWTKISYDITFDLALEGRDPMTQTGVHVDDTVVLPDATGETGYEAGYWYWVIDGDHFTEDFALTQDMIRLNTDEDGNTSLVLHVQWTAKTYTVKVDTTGMTDAQAEAIRMNYPDKTVVFADPAGVDLWDIGDYTPNIHQEFGGWVLSDGTVMENEANLVVTAEIALLGDAAGGDILFTIQWNEVLFRLHYDVNGGGVVQGNVPADSFYHYQDPVDLWEPTNAQLVKDGYIRGGWSYNAAGNSWDGTTFDDTLTMAAHNNGGTATLTAIWDKQTYYIGYDLESGSRGERAPTSALYGDIVYIDHPTRNGYEFAGWRAEGITSGAMYEGENGFRPWTSGAKTDATAFMNLCSINEGRVTLTATWERATYNLAPDQNGGEVIFSLGENDTATVGEPITLPLVSSAERTGYTFAGWGTDDTTAIPDGTVLEPSMAPATGKNLVLYAIWDPIDYNVQSKTRDASDYRTTTADYDAGFKLSPGTRNGFEFGGWSVTGASLASAMASDNGTDWVRIGSFDSPLQYEYFKNLTSNQGDTIDFVAVWNPISYSIAYDTNGADAEAPVDTNLYTVGDTVTVADYNQLGTYGDKTPVGWATTRDATEPQYTTTIRFSEGFTVNADDSDTITLYAVWAAGMVMVTVDVGDSSVENAPVGWSDNGSGVYTKSFESDTPVSEVMSEWQDTDVSKDGYNFEGWDHTSGKVSSDLVISPEYDKVDNTVTYIIVGVVAALIVGTIVVARFRP